MKKFRITAKAESAAVFISLFGSLTASGQFLPGEWLGVNPQASWTGRHSFVATVFQDKMWVMGGRVPTPVSANQRMNDVWYSDNGVNWKQQTPSAAWIKRGYFNGTTHDGKMWIMGGDDGSYQDDVWSSTDGTNWVEVTDAAGWPGRAYFGCLSYDNKLWVLGGQGNPDKLNDVWYSTNGSNWTQATSSAPWADRQVTAATVFDSKMWVLGGWTDAGSTNDVWWSTNGLDWVQATEEAEWAGRTYAPAAASFLGYMWLISGTTIGANPTNEVWYSMDGITWEQSPGVVPWLERNGSSALVFENNLWLLGGSASGGGPTAFLNDIWNAPNFLASISVSAVDVEWQSVSGIPYQVQWAESLVTPVWSNLNDIVIGTGSNMYVTDIIRGVPTRHYRILADPEP